MKKSLLKASLFCLGATLLCGLYSFRFPEQVESQGHNVSIVYDTIITSKGEEPHYIKEIGVEGDQGDCKKCLVTLKIVSPLSNKWILKVINECPKSIVVTCEYNVTTASGQQDCYTEFEHSEVEVNGNGSETIAEGWYDCSYCEPTSVSARFK